MDLDNTQLPAIDRAAGVETIPTDATIAQEPALDSELPNHGSAVGTDLERLVGMVFDELQALRNDFASKIQYDETKQHQLDSMHAELQAHREGFHFRVLRPVLVDLISLFDDLSKQVEVVGTAKSAANVGDTAAWSVFLGTVEEILRRNGVEAFSVDGNSGGVRRQRVINIIQTPDPTLDGSVARRLRPGFAYEDRVLRPEWVEVYQYKAVSDSTEEKGADHV